MSASPLRRSWIERRWVALVYGALAIGCIAAAVVTAGGECNNGHGQSLIGAAGAVSAGIAVAAGGDWRRRRVWLGVAVVLLVYVGLALYAISSAQGDCPG